MFSKLLKKIPSFKIAPNITLDIIINPPFVNYLVTTMHISNGYLPCFERLKTFLTTPYYFDPYFDPYLTVGTDLYSELNIITTFSEKWKSSLIKANLSYAGITIYYYVFAGAISVLEQEIQIIMNLLLARNKRKTAYVSDLLCFHVNFANILELERQEKEIKNALKQANSKAESNKKQVKIYPIIQYNSEFLDEKWNLVEKCVQQNDNKDGWDIVETYEAKPIAIAPFRNQI